VDRGFGLSKALYLGEFTASDTAKMREIINKLFMLIKNGKDKFEKRI